MTESTNGNINCLAKYLDNPESDKSFISEILSKFRKDEIGNLCCTDNVLLMVGRKLWQKSKLKLDQKNEVRKSVMNSMRQLAALYVTFKTQEAELGPLEKKDGNLGDLFYRCNFEHLEQALSSYSFNHKQGAVIKYGSKIQLYYLVKKACKIMKSMCLIKNDEIRADSLDKFINIFEMNHDYIFGDAVYAGNKI